MKFLKTLTKAKKQPTGKAKAADGTVRKYSEVKRAKLAYQTDYRLPIEKHIRQRLSSKDAVKLSSYVVHNASNISRLEFEIEKNDGIRAIFDDTLTVTKYSIVITGFIIEFNKGLCRIQCRYMTNSDRHYTITHNGLKVYERVLDSPVIEDYFDEFQFTGEDPDENEAQDTHTDDNVDEVRVLGEADNGTHD